MDGKPFGPARAHVAREWDDKEVITVTKEDSPGGPSSIQPKDGAVLASTGRSWMHRH